MRDPVRLLQDDAASSERTLLEAAQHDAPPADGARALAAVLGVAAPIAPVASVTTGSAAWSKIALKLVAAGALTGAATIWITAPQATSTVPAPTATAPRVELIPDGAAPLAADPLAAEVALLDRARTALAARDARGALELLADYDRKHGAGALQQEASRLRIEALLQIDVRAAQELAGRFLNDHAGSPHAPRIRALLEAASAR